ncbi:MAG: plastocyanin/azurin family copper-binding protein [Saprospiraceae bacterium]|nr:plastocyanin/azurin family copper-binding protein [Saprospiraceae bacterium]
MKNSIILILFLFPAFVFAQDKASEGDYYDLKTLPIPSNIELEVGGMATIPDGRLAVSTRRGEVWMVENPYSITPYYRLFAKGMHEVLGLTYHKGALYAVQRGELTKLTDTDGDGEADFYQNIANWELAGNYHEYSYGPVFDKDDNMFLTFNVAWVGFGEAKLSKWRGWMVKVTPDGTLTPIAAGLRSPAGVMMNTAGDIFYTENQGDWVGSGRITHLEKGDFAGHASSLFWTSEPNSPIKIKKEDIPDNSEPMFKAAEKIKNLKLPAVWFPHTMMGISTADMIEDVQGNFGSFFKGQYFVSDQGHSKIMRMQLEKINGQYQGACFPFREGFQSGLLRLSWGNDGSMFGGMTSRGWSSTGKDLFGLQRLIWSGKTPFEMGGIHAMSDGFELTFTKPVDKTTATNPANYDINSFIYEYHHAYGSPVIENKAHVIKAIIVSDDLTKVRLVLDESRRYFIYEIKPKGVNSKENEPLLHEAAYYTLNNIPATAAADLSKNTMTMAKAMPAMNHTGHSMSMKPLSKKEQKAREKAALAAVKRQTTMPANWSAPDKVIAIGTKPVLKYDVETVEVKAGSKVKLIFSNLDDDMTHNLVIVEPGTADVVGNLAIKLGIKGSQMSYVPNTPKVLYHTSLIQPSSSETIYFVAPLKAGNYTYVCTYPGHHAVMQGILKVVE